MARPRGPLFVERQSYRRRRLMDAARVLPVLGFVLVLLPVLWTQGGAMGTAGQALYLFALWLGLIAVAAAMSRALSREARREAGREGGRDTARSAPPPAPAPSTPPGEPRP